jgi:hypothetical protein
VTTASKFGPLQWVIVILTVFTAAVHLWIGVALMSPPDPIFILNGVGYLGLLGLLYLPIGVVAPYRHVVRWVLIGYAAITFFAWLFIGARSTMAYIDKAAELALIICLWLEWQQGRRSAAA